MIEPGRSERGGVAGLEGSVADRAIDVWSRMASDREPFGFERHLWRLRCGAPWRDVPEKYGKWNTIYRRFRRWSEAGT